MIIRPYLSRTFTPSVRSVWLILLTLILSVGSAQVAAKSTLTDIAVKRLDNGDASVSLTFSDAAVAADFRQPTPQQVMLRLPNVQLKPALLAVLDTRRRQTPVTEIETFQASERARIVMRAEQAVEFDYQQQGKVLTIRVSAARKALSATALAQKGAAISINFQDIPVRTVLQLIAEQNDFNLVTSDSVQGNITMRIDGVPWQDVLDVILRVKGLDKRQRGQVMLVAPRRELMAQEKQALEMRQQADALLPLSSEVLTVNYAKASDIAALIKGQGEGVSLLSPRGAVSLDERTNALIIKDNQKNLARIRTLVRHLDVPVKQVEIEARIVTVEQGSVDELGVRWGLLNRNGSTTVGPSVEGNLMWDSNVTGQGPESLNDAATDGANIGDFLSVNLAAANPSASSMALQVAKLGNDLLLDLELSALESERKAEVVSSPRLITTNKKAAYIEQGTELPYLEASSSGAVAVSFKKAVLSLSVTPQITPNNTLVLDLKLTQDMPEKAVVAGKGEAMSISTKRINTQVLAENGETVVLGGIFQQTMINKETQVPLLGDIPLVGNLFKHQLKDHAKRELLIFVTPKIVTD
ncbi:MULTISPECIES: type IV pilus secretin PilQ [unclassified Salinivibrio]|uniref:type IV pilus secretin PilQ n=1 Tax=unclassified Salinivibrio TaxID=2636825 RepID=UPI00128E014E|nr:MULTISPECIES: type IV pilus secretin PilQ [unclassified Salinivibrio]MPS32703.1 type IV pilus secretin PilQ [Salinivibrio sp. VYel7]MPX90755.1 type IV pilus secretin PilQ [Salinivibrio sp. VYel1]MPX94093.1 type IV pilus secretin PilQ [Salinivibrio sp. VYel9]MPX96801.1 type IV pilus secretin PilQ [Salinivibrio sp. VYel6]MPY00047.1 type IV pilus secretin PilQ [Salinivibrio sp. VYel4]